MTFCIKNNLKLPTQACLLVANQENGITSRVNPVQVKSQQLPNSVPHLRAQKPCLWNGLDTCDTAEVLIAEYLKHKAAKEIPHSNNSPEIQKKVDQVKRLEWETMVNKPGVVKVHYGKHAQKIREEQAHRFIGSRFVLTRKAIEEGQAVKPEDPTTYTVKGRWCLQGHLDPDLQQKAEEGKLQSPSNIESA